MSDKPITEADEREREDGAYSEAVEVPDSVESEVSETETDITAEEKADEGDKASKRKRSLKDLFSHNDVYTMRFLSFLEILIMVLCLVQVVFWMLALKDDASRYLDAIIKLDYVNIVVMIFMTVFIALIAVNAVKGVISVVKKDPDPHFESVSTLFAFYVFSLFFAHLFDGTDVLISSVDFSQLFKIILELILGYAVVRLFLKDFSLRIVPISFCCIGIVLSIIMFSQNIGEFASFSIDGGQEVKLADMDMYHYLESVVKAELNLNAPEGMESLYFEHGELLNFKGLDMDETIAVFFLQFTPIMASDILPFAAVSMLGYLMFGLTGKHYVQYYHLQICKKISIKMLIVAFLSLAATVVFYFVCNSNDGLITVKFNYLNIIVTLSVCFIMIVITALPWEIYSIIYEQRYEAYQKAHVGEA